jgi:ribosomal protein S18 acetylase RimI-like enzyme
MMRSESNDRVAVRPATTSDIDFMVQLFLELAHHRSPTGEGVDIDAIEQGTRQATLAQVQGAIEDSTTYVIEFDGWRAGRLRVVRTAAHIEIAGLQVLPAHQDRGIGTAVITALVQEATSRAVPVVLQVDKDNPGAKRLYLRLGFIKFDETSDTYWMRATR